MLLSVLSALARLDLDPWQEAAKLAGMPGETAVQNLASIIAAQPDVPSARRDPGAIAVRLTALLPRTTGSGVASRAKQAGAGKVTQIRTGIPTYAILILFMLVAQWITASHLPSKQDVNASAAGIDTPHVQPAGSAHPGGSPVTPPKTGEHAAETKLVH